MISQGERVRAASRRRREVEKQELRQAILTAAAELILERGYDAFSLRRVAERIGYSATTIYLYYESKDDLVAAVLAEGFERFVRALEAVQTEDPAERVADLGRAYVAFGLANRVHYQLMFMRRMDLLLREGAGEPRSFEILVSAVERAIESGAFRAGDARLYGLVLWAAIHGVVALAIQLPQLDEPTLRAATETALDVAARGLAPG
jgi:AcrR family transcriptional regulator